MTIRLLSGGNASLNQKNIQTVSLVTSLTNNLLIKVNVLRLYSVPLKFTSIHSSPGLSSTGTIWIIILLLADTVDGFRRAVHHWD